MGKGGVIMQEEMKECFGCKQIKPFTSQYFPKRTQGKKLKTLCIVCNETKDYCEDGKIYRICRICREPQLLEKNFQMINPKSYTNLRRRICNCCQNNLKRKLLMRRVLKYTSSRTILIYPIQLALKSKIKDTKSFIHHINE